MKPLIELKDSHVGEDIYVIGSGKSLDYIDPDFLEGKVKIGVNQVYKKIDCDYLVRKEIKFLDASLKTGAKVIVSKFDSGNFGSLKNSTDLKSDLLYFFDHLHNRERQIDRSVFGTEKIVVSYSTITSAIHIAAYMGAKNVILIGHDCGTLNNEFAFNGYHDSIQDTPWKNWDQYKGWLKVIEDQTVLVRNEIKRVYNTNLVSINPFVSLNLENNLYK